METAPAPFAPPRPDLEGLRHSTQSAEVVVKELRDLLGARLVAYIAGVKETRAVHEWADGAREVGNQDRTRRLRTSLQVALLLRMRDKPDVVQAWFQGLNPQLGDRAPARLLREGDIDVAGPEVLAAARSFSAVG
ncbi:MAG: hypothetical protein ACRDWB_13710 [Acidimicrobiales bacterium]